MSATVLSVNGHAEKNLPKNLRAIPHLVSTVTPCTVSGICEVTIEHNRSRHVLWRFVHGPEAPSILNVDGTISVLRVHFIKNLFCVLDCQSRAREHI